MNMNLLMDQLIVAGEPTHNAEELIVAASQRAVARQVSQMPFADQRSAIARAAQQAGSVGRSDGNPISGRSVAALA